MKKCLPSHWQKLRRADGIPDIALAESIAAVADRRMSGNRVLANHVYSLMESIDTLFSLHAQAFPCARFLQVTGLMTRDVCVERMKRGGFE